MINIHLDNNPQLAANETFSGLFLSRERIRKRNAAGENTAPPPSNSSLLPQSPSRSPLPLDFKPSDKPPMVLFNEIPNAVNFFYSMDPAVLFTPGHNHSGPSTNDAAYPRGFCYVFSSFPFLSRLSPKRPFTCQHEHILSCYLSYLIFTLLYLLFLFLRYSLTTHIRTGRSIVYSWTSGTYGSS